MTLDIRLLTAFGNGSGIALTPTDVPKVVEWMKKAGRNAKGTEKMPLWSPTPPRERAKEMVPGVPGQE